MSKPVIIGVSCMRAQDTYGGIVVGMRPSYLESVEAAGGIPLLIHLTEETHVVRALYQLCDGILLTGGDDIDPAYFQEEPHPQLGDVDPLRDKVELQLVQWTREDKKPLMGICRGLQVINVAFGGSLYQDIPSQFETNINHRANVVLQNREALTHNITLEPTSWLAEQLGTAEIAGNSLHHQSIKQVAANLQVVGTAPDGIIEAIEGTGEQFVAAVQCHPENLWPKSETRWRRIFERFVAIAAETRA